MGMERKRKAMIGGFAVVAMLAAVGAVAVGLGTALTDDEIAAPAHQDAASRADIVMDVSDAPASDPEQNAVDQDSDDGWSADAPSASLPSAASSTGEPSPEKGNPADDTVDFGSLDPGNGGSSGGLEGGSEDKPEQGGENSGDEGAWTGYY